MISQPYPVRFKVKEVQHLFGGTLWDCTLTERTPEKVFTVRYVAWEMPRGAYRREVIEVLFWQLAEYKEKIGER